MEKIKNENVKEKSKFFQNAKTYAESVQETIDKNTEAQIMMSFDTNGNISISVIGSKLNLLAGLCAVISKDEAELSKLIREALLFVAMEKQGYLTK